MYNYWGGGENILSPPPPHFSYWGGGAAPPRPPPPAFYASVPRYVNSFTWFSVVSSTLMSSSMVIVEFGWNITSVFFMLILRPNFDDALANASTILWISSAISALSSAKSSSLTSIFVVFVFALKCIKIIGDKIRVGRHDGRMQKNVI